MLTRTREGVEPILGAMRLRKWPTIRVRTGRQHHPDCGCGLGEQCPMLPHNALRPAESGEPLPRRLQEEAR